MTAPPRIESWLWMHPAYPSSAFDRIDVVVERRSPTALSLVYKVSGHAGDAIVPPPARQERADNLWKATCFEALIRPNLGTAYLELNFSPSGRWAAYHFTRYRTGMVQFPLPGLPEITFTSRPGSLELAVLLSLDLPDEPCALALTAVLEEKAVGKSYWAAAHPAGAPDFHHPDCFVDELPAAKPA